ncbi:MAG: hypothetical protein WAL50_00475 [Kineosporiaceae bacterium]
MTIPICPGPGVDEDELRGWASRKILAEDAHWAMDTILSGRPTHFGPLVALLLGHHVARIAYEGAQAVRSTNQYVGIPALADLLDDKFAALTTQARHLTKLLDNKSKSYSDVLSEFQAELGKHRNLLTGKAPRWARWLETDLGLYYYEGSLLGATAPIAYRLGLDPTQDAAMWGANLRAVSEEWGGTLAVLGAATLDPREPRPTIDLTRVRTTYKDRRADRYLASRFDPHFPPELKALLLMIEGDINTARLIIPLTETGHTNAGFRARTVTLFHCLSSLRRIDNEYSRIDTSGLRGLRALLADAATQRLLSRSGEMVRNRSVHYQMNDPELLPHLNRPMCGLIEILCPGMSWEDFDKDVREVTERAAEHLGSWGP